MNDYNSYNNQNKSEISIVGEKEFYEGGMGSELGLLYYNNLFIDTVETFFGAHIIGNDSLVYLPVHSFNFDSIEGATAIWGEYTFFDKGIKNLLNKTLPYLDDYFSSPGVIEKTFYYWGLAPSSKKDWNRIIATRYNFQNSELDSIYLYDDIMETDNANYFHPIILEGQNVIYETSSQKWLVDKNTFEILDHRFK